ncbi:hypothetical protein GCK32_015873 [Trichostrongylus colubriformis]|uniref:Peptidase A2 domain-containing protein n=1 Tax=Trichostrongylus colubriformis TaxID=6319 RepID=A0AAN8ISZ8_TRICO
MEHIQKYALDRAVQRLQNAINNIDRTLLEELPTDGDPEQVSQRVSARRRALTALHLVLTREVDSSSNTWESVMQSALTVEEDHVRRALINEYQAHWAVIGGVEAENTIHELILLVEAALHLLPQEHAATIASTPLRPTMYTGSRSITSFAHRVTPTPGEVPPQARGRHPEGETTSEELAQPSTDSHQSENIVPSNLPNAELPSHTLQEQLVRLPKFDLPIFTGDIAKFGEFWDVFDSAVHSNRLIPATIKFHYLRSSLKDDALALVAGYDITEANYELAVSTLRESYFRPTFMRVQMSRRLEDHPKASSSAISQRITLARIKSIWLQLKKLGEQESNVFVMRIIREKFPSRTLEYVGHQQAQDEATWGVSQLLDALDSSIRTFEAIEDSAHRGDTQLQTMALRSDSRSPSREPSPSTSRRRRVSRSPSRSRRSESRREGRCAFCHSPQHRTYQCDVGMSIQARRRIAQDYRLCYRCLSQYHTVHECERPPCPICQGGHHKLLCRKATRYLYREHRSRSSSRSSRSPSRDREERRRGYPSSERGRPRHRVRSPSPRRTTPTREGTRARSVRFRDSPSQNYVETDPFAPLYVGDIVDTEDEDPMVNTIAQCSAQRRRRPLPEDPRLMVVTARTRNRNTFQDELIVLLLDSGAQYSFIKEDTAKRLGLRFEDPQCLTTKSFGGHTTTEVSSVVHIVLWDTVDAEMQFTVRTRQITTSIRKDTYISHRDVNLLRSSNNQSLLDTEVDIDLLIGIDYYWRIVDPFKTRTLPSGHTLVYTRFGPVMSGMDASSSTNALSVGMATETGGRGDDPEPDVRQLWDLEFLGINDSVNPRQDDIVNEEVVKQYYDTVQVIDGIVYVQFPWKQQHPRLLDNKVIALKRLEYQYDKLHNQPDLWREYCTTFENQERSGIIEEVAEYDFDGPRSYKRRSKPE